MNESRVLPFPLSNYWPVMSNSEIYTFIAVCFAIVVLVVLFSWYKKLKRDEYRDTLENSSFTEIANEIGLSEQEKKTVTRMAARIKKTASDVVSTQYIFELAVHSFFESKTGKSTETVSTISALRLKCGFDRQIAGQPLFSTRSLSLNQKASLIYNENSEEAPNRATITNLDEISFTIGKTDGEFPKKTIGTALILIVQQSDDGEYRFVVPVLSCSAKSITFGHSMDFVRKQVREFVRVDSDIDVKFRFSKADRAPDRLNGGARFQAKLIDISGGGTALQSTEKFDIGDRIIMSFSYAGNNFYGVKGDILRIREKNSNNQSLYIHQIQFVDIDLSLREKLIRHIFIRHREEIQWHKAVGNRNGNFGVTDFRKQP